VKTNKDRHTLSAVQIFGRDSSFLCGHSQGFSRKDSRVETSNSNDSGVARHAHVLRSHAEVYSLCA